MPRKELFYYVTWGSNFTRDVHWCVTVFYQQIENSNIANQIHGFTIDYGKFILICIKLQALDKLEKLRALNFYLNFSTSEAGHFGTCCHKLLQQFRVGKSRNREYHSVSLLGYKIIVPLFLNVRRKIPRNEKSRYFVHDLQLQTKQCAISSPIQTATFT